ncbi:hypothetical protein QBC40DRAFT_299434 [Triangularia verruculosa]|uniref:Uncharacterized protein n=1 Tax=Triangularia verruculosa TaxID=2587418 RepID=A0AAN7ATY6_9PEZI|nr:hypothetical protein QBC40DRAFT_299434 [Triangularia verruculosa]
MYLPHSEHQEPVQPRLHERRQFRDAFEPVTRTPEEVDDAIYRHIPLSPAAPRLRVAEPSVVAVPSRTLSPSSMLVPLATPVPTTLVVSTLTASSIITTAPITTGTVVIHETSQNGTATAGQNLWEIPNANPGTKFIIAAVALSIPLLILLIMGKDIYRRHIHPSVHRRWTTMKAERAQAAADARAKMAAAAATEKKDDGDDNNGGDGLDQAKESSSTDATIVAKTNTAPTQPSNPPTTTTGAGRASTGFGSREPSTSNTKKVEFIDPDSIMPAPKADFATPRTADQAAAATQKSIQLASTAAFPATRSLTHPVVKSCCKGKVEGSMATSDYKPAYVTTSDHNPAYAPTKPLSGYTSNTVASSTTTSGDRPLSKISEETEAGSSVTASSAESLNTAMRQNVRLHSLISGSDDSVGDHDDRRSNSSASTVKAVGTAL